MLANLLDGFISFGGRESLMVPIWLKERGLGFSCDRHASIMGNVGLFWFVL